MNERMKLRRAGTRVGCDATHSSLSTRFLWLFDDSTNFIILILVIWQRYSISLFISPMLPQGSFLFFDEGTKDKVSFVDE